MKWISVKDQLPEEDHSYLIRTNDDCMYVAYWSKSYYAKNHFTWKIQCECSNAEDDLLNEDSITHWMPLPKEPKDE